MHTEYEVRVLEIDESKVTSIDVQGVFKKFYNIDIAKVEKVSFNVPLEEKYYIKQEKARGKWFSSF